VQYCINVSSPWKVLVDEAVQVGRDFDVTGDDRTNSMRTKVTNEQTVLEYDILPGTMLWRSRLFPK
jgi:hypothetical protein